jgi:hypothetical protein
MAGGMIRSIAAMSSLPAALAGQRMRERCGGIGTGLVSRVGPILGLNDARALAERVIASGPPIADLQIESRAVLTEQATNVRPISEGLFCWWLEAPWQTHAAQLPQDSFETAQHACGSSSAMREHRFYAAVGVSPSSSWMPAICTSVILPTREALT